jgi:hypothetical protein
MVNSSLKLKDFLKSRDEEIYKKFSDIELQIIKNKEICNKNSFEEDLLKVWLKIENFENFQQQTNTNFKDLQHLQDFVKNPQKN